jgi:tetratricopeptide (TPR) repeat protein
MNAVEDLKTIREHLARSKNYYHRLERGYQKADVFRSLVSFAEAVKLLVTTKLVGRQKMEAENAMEGMLQQLNKVEDVKAYANGGFKNKRGQPKILLVQVLKVIKVMQEDLSKESYEAARQRKLQIDQLLSLGRKRLEDERYVEAENAFKEAVQLYVDEHMLFSVIGQAYLQQERPKDALGYLEKAMDKAPDHEMTYLWVADAYQKMGVLDAAADAVRRGLRQAGESADLYVRLAELNLGLELYADATEAAEKALELTPQLVKARKLLADIAKKAPAENKKPKPQGG